MKAKKLFLFSSFFFLWTFVLAQDDAMLCTQEYDPVCVQIQECEGDACDSSILNMPNTCVAKARGAKILYKGECKEVELKTLQEQDESPGGNFDLPPENMQMPPTPMDEPGEIKPIFPTDDRKVEIIMDDLSSYASDAREEKDLLNLSGQTFKAYDDGSIMLNIKDLDTFQDAIEISGFIYPAKGNWTVFEGVLGVVLLQDLQSKTLKTAQLKLQKGFDLSSIKDADKIWFKANIALANIPDGSYFLLFKNENPSGLEENNSEFKINIKVKKPKKELSLDEKLKDKYPGYILLHENKDKSELILSKKSKVKILWLFPVVYEKQLTLDKKTLIVKDIKTPWWSWLVF